MRNNPGIGDFRQLAKGRLQHRVAARGPEAGATGNVDPDLRGSRRHPALRRRRPPRRISSRGGYSPGLREGRGCADLRDTGIQSLFFRRAQKRHRLSVPPPCATARRQARRRHGRRSWRSRHRAGQLSASPGAIGPQRPRRAGPGGAGRGRGQQVRWPGTLAVTARRPGRRCRLIAKNVIAMLRDPADKDV